MITRMNQMQKSDRSESGLWTRVTAVQRAIAVQWSGVVGLLLTALDRVHQGLELTRTPKLQPIRIDDRHNRPRTNNKYYDSRK